MALKQVCLDCFRPSENDPVAGVLSRQFSLKQENLCPNKGDSRSNDKIFAQAKP